MLWFWQIIQEWLRLSCLVINVVKELGKGEILFIVNVIISWYSYYKNYCEKNFF